MPKEIPVRCYGVSAIVLRKNGRKNEVLLLKRATSSFGQWCQVAGGIEPGETAWQAALREIREETTLVPERLYSADLLEHFYETEKDAIWIAPVFVAFVGAGAKVQLNHEHSDYRWISFRKAIALVPFTGQKEILQNVERAFTKQEPLELLHIRTDQ
jgi:dATP pyrophosphohydrolase